MFCPECGTENRSNARFCKGCGLRFDDDDAAGETISPYETTISIQPAEPSRTTVFATPSYNESSAQESAFKPGDSNSSAPPVAPTVPVGDRTTAFGGGSTPLAGFGETSSSSGLVVGDLVPSASLTPPPPPDEMPILLIGQDDLAPPTVPNTPFPINPHDPETVPSRPLPPVPPPTMVAPAVPPPPPLLPAGRATMPPSATPTLPPPIPATAVMASVPPPIPPTSVMAPVPPPGSGFAGVMPLRADPSPSPQPPAGTPDLPPDVAAQPFKPIAPPGGTPRPMGQARPADHAAPRPPADLFSQPAPTAAAEGKKSKTPLILGLLGGVGILFLLLVGIGFVAYQRFAKPKPVPQPVKTTPPDDTTTPPTTTEPPTPAPVIPPDMVAIPGGEYVIGRNEGDLLDKYESPQHPVTLQPFYIDKTEVTNADYKKFMDATGHGAPTSWPNGQIKQGTEYFPVTGVSHADAEAYAKWAGKRLPTEDEWEAAAHGRTPSLFPWGNDQDFSRMNIKPSGIEAPVRVGASPAGASPFGVFDMSGNVWEWTASQAAPYPGSKEVVTPDASGKPLMVIRGGAFNEVPKRCTTTFRNWVPADFKGKELGFRCVKNQ